MVDRRGVHPAMSKIECLPGRRFLGRHESRQYRPSQTTTNESPSCRHAECPMFPAENGRPQFGFLNWGQTPIEQLDQSEPQ